MDKQKLDDLLKAGSKTVSFEIRAKKKLVGSINSQMLQRAAECEHRQAMGHAMATYMSHKKRSVNMKKNG